MPWNGGNENYFRYIPNIPKQHLKPFINRIKFFLVKKIIYTSRVIGKNISSLLPFRPSASPPSYSFLTLSFTFKSPLVCGTKQSIHSISSLLLFHQFPALCIHIISGETYLVSQSTISNLRNTAAKAIYNSAQARLLSLVTAETSEEGLVTLIQYMTVVPC